MATTIVTKNSSTASAVPTAAQLVQGELAVNVADKRIYTENNAGAVVELGTNPSAEIVANGGIALPDNGKATFGASDDLQIYHDGADSYINDSGVGDLKVGGNQIQLNNAAQTKNYIYAVDGAQVELKYNNALKLATTATGIDVTGTATMDGLTVDGTGTFGALSSKIKVGLNGDSISSDADFYIQTSTANHLILRTNFTERMRIDSAGNVGIGTSSPLARLDVESGTGNVGFNYGTLASPSRGNLWYDTDGSGWQFNIGKVQAGAFTSQVTLQDNGNVGIGTSSPSAKLTIQDGDFARLDLNLSNATGTTIADVRGLVEGVEKWRIGRTSSASDDFAVNVTGTERMRIDSAGNLLLNTANSPTTTKAVISSDYSAAGTTNTGLTITGRQGGNWYNNGIHALGASGLVFSTGTTGVNGADATNERMRIDSAGNVGIGTSSPTAKADLVGGDVTGGLKISADKTTSSFFAFGADANETRITSSSYGGFKPLTVHTGGTERMRIDSAGNVGIGTTSPAAKLHAAISATGEVARFSAPNGSIGSIILGRPDVSTEGLKLEYDSNTGNCSFGTVSTGHQLLFKSGTAERMRIDGSGNLLVGTTTPRGIGATIYNPNGVGRIDLNKSDSGAATAMGFYYVGGLVGSISYSDTATSYNTSSDQRLKENIADADDAGSKIDAIQVRQYDWKADGLHQDYGMIAQELQLVAPEAVSGDANSDEMMGVDYSKLVPMLIKEIQSLRNRVAQLEA